MAAKTITILTISDLIHEANLHRKVKTLLSDGYQVTLFAVHHPNLDRSLWQGIHLKLIKLKTQITPLRFALFFFKATFWLFFRRADLFVAYDCLPLLPLRIKKLFQQCTYIYDSVELFLGINALVNRPWRRRFWDVYEKWGIAGAGAAFTVCESDAVALQKTYPDLPAPRFVRNIPEFSPLPENNMLREKYNIGGDLKAGIYQGKIFKGRGLEQLIEAMRGVDGLVLFIIGDGPLKPKLKQMVQEFRLEKKVIFIDAVPFQALPRYTAAADIGFTIISGTGLSYLHALPNKLFEYIQAGLPVIGSNYPEIAKIIEREAIGYTVDPRDTEGIRTAIDKIMQDKNYDCFKNNLRQIREKYTWQNESKKYLEIVRSALFIAEQGAQ